MEARYRSTKRFWNFPCCHRQHKHDGHCRFIHGYSREFKFWFECTHLDENNFVVDFSALDELKSWLEHMFDHTVLINADDPERALFEQMHAREVVNLRILPSVSMEATAKYVFEYADVLVRKSTAGRCWVAKVLVAENDKNSAEYELVERVPAAPPEIRAPGASAEVAD